MQDRSDQSSLSPIPDGIELTPFDERFYLDPYEVYGRLRTMEPLHRDRVSMYENSWTVTSYALVKQLLLDPTMSVDGRKVDIARDPRAENPLTQAPPDMMFLDDPDHGRLRKLVQKAFTPNSVEQMRPRIEVIVDGLLAGIKLEDSFDLVTQVCKPLPTIVIAELLGVDSSDHNLFKQWTDSLLLQGYPQPTEGQWDEAVAADQSLRNYIEMVIEQRRSNPRDDLISRLINARDDGNQLNEAELVQMCFLVIAGGNFTSTDLMSNALLALIQSPGTYELLRNDPQRIEDVVEEVLRYDGPSLVVRRFAIKDTKIGGQIIKKGEVVNLVLAAANHDSLVFDNADDFRPSREQNNHMAFGRGIHHCLGVPLIRLETQILLSRFVQQMPPLEVVEMKRTRSMGFRGLRKLVVRRT